MVMLSEAGPRWLEHSAMRQDDWSPAMHGKLNKYWTAAGSRIRRAEMVGTGSSRTADGEESVEC
jgi:hypothetical protein